MFKKYKRQQKQLKMVIALSQMVADHFNRKETLTKKEYVTYATALGFEKETEDVKEK